MYKEQTILRRKLVLLWQCYFCLIKLNDSFLTHKRSQYLCKEKRRKIITFLFGTTMM